MKRPGFLKDAIAKSDGYYSPKGEKLKSQKMSQEEQDAWNGVEEKPAPKKLTIEIKDEVAEEVTVVEEAVAEVSQETMVQKLTKKVKRKKK